VHTYPSSILRNTTPLSQPPDTMTYYSQISSSLASYSAVTISAKLLLAVMGLMCVLVQDVSSRSVCMDRNPSCGLWASEGECYKNIGFMHIHCAESCQQCQVQDDLCRDETEQCPAWAEKGECTLNRKFMKKNCPRACGVCQPTNSHDIPHIHNDILSKYWAEHDAKHPAPAHADEAVINFLG